jgi:ABC-type glycerol-3-phosphate transport system permease component
MFYALLLVTFAVAAGVSWVAVRIFSKPADVILKRIIQDDIYRSWLTYLKFALYVVGISAGVRIHQLEQYISPKDWKNEGHVLALNAERWTLEVYRTVIETLQGVAWVLLVYFVVALVAFVIVRIVEVWRKAKTDGKTL